jgi:hypothetical protein
MAASKLFPLAAALCIAGTTLKADSGEEILKRVDHYRYPWPEFSVEVTLQDGKVKQQWQVVVRENGDARVEGLSEKEKGRVVLFLKDDLWLVLPNAKRPVKVSPQQRMLGPAAGGDIARFKFSGDYAVAKDSEEPVDGAPARRLELQAKTKALSYQSAVLWINREGAPIKADFYYGSGKLARSARYGDLSREAGVQVLSNLRLEEPSGRGVTLEFAHWKPIHADDQWFQLPGHSE